MFVFSVGRLVSRHSNAYNWLPESVLAFPEPKALAARMTSAGFRDVSWSLLFGGILMLASLGTYSLNTSMLDLVLLYAVGAVGCVMRLYDVPLVPAVLGLVLGPLAELQCRRALAISEGDPSVFVTRPVCAVLLAMAAAALIAPVLVKRRLA